MSIERFALTETDVAALIGRYPPTAYERSNALAGF
jgi:hypothetical protein